MLKRLMMLFGFILSILAATLAPVSALEVNGPRDCDNNAVIRCGALSTAELKRKYREDTYAQKVFSDFGISAEEMRSVGSTAVAGKVTQRGNVYIEGRERPVATNAMTAGRQDISGSAPVFTGGVTYYKRDPSVSFQRQSLPAFVVMENGRFQYAVIASCGNPVTATPIVRQQPQQSEVPTPQAPVPEQPAPAAQTQSQAQSQTQQVIVEQQPVVVHTVAEKPAPAPQRQEALPNVGTSSVAGLFAATSAVGAWLYRRKLLSY